MSNAAAQAENWEVPPSFNLAADVLDRLALEDRTGLVYVDSYGYRRDYRYAEIADLSQRYAAALRDFGIEQGERILLVLPRIAKALFTALAIDRIGAVAVVCPRDAAKDQLIDAVLEAGVTTIIANRSTRGLAEQLIGTSPLLSRYLLIGDEGNEWLRLDTAADGKAPYRGVISASEDEAFIVYERERGLVFDRAYLYASGKNAASCLDARASDIAWQTAGPLWSAFAPWSCGAASVLHDAPFDPRERLDLVRELNVTVLVQSEREYAAEIELPDFDRFRLPHLRRCVALGRPDGSAVAPQWARATGHALISCYSAPEAPLLTIDGHPVAGLRLAILDTEGNACAPQKAGAIAVSRDTPALFRRCIGAESPSSKSWFLTGDHGLLQADGRLVLTSTAV